MKAIKHITASFLLLCVAACGTQRNGAKEAQVLQLVYQEAREQQAADTNWVAPTNVDLFISAATRAKLRAVGCDPSKIQVRQTSPCRDEATVPAFLEYTNTSMKWLVTHSGSVLCIQQ